MAGNKGKIAVTVAGVAAVLGLAGGLGHQTGTEMAADSRAAVGSSSAAAPSAHRPQTLDAATLPSTTTASTPAAPPPPVPAMAMTCPAGGTNASPVYGQQITATAPYTVVIDYGDGEVEEAVAVAQAAEAVLAPAVGAGVCVVEGERRPDVAVF